MKYEPGDIFLTAGPGILSRGVRLGSQSPGEAQTRVSHTGIIVRNRINGDADIVEARHRVVMGRLSRYQDGKTLVAVYRDRRLSFDDRQTISYNALGYLNKRYGYLKIGANAGDFLLSQVLRRDIYLIRRLMFLDRYPICSWVVAYAGQEFGWKFGVPPVNPRRVAPDDIDDTVLSFPEDWEEVRPLSKL